MSTDAMREKLLTRDAKVTVSRTALLHARSDLVRRVFTDIELSDMAVLTNNDHTFPIRIDDFKCEAFVTSWAGEGIRLTRLYLQAFPAANSSAPDWAGDGPIFIGITITYKNEQCQFAPTPIVAYGYSDASPEYFEPILG